MPSNHRPAPPLPGEQLEGNKTERAFTAFWNDAITIHAVAELLPKERSAQDRHAALIFALVKAAFMEGARYATGRCEDAGHHRSKS